MEADNQQPTPPQPARHCGAPAASPSTAPPPSEGRSKGGAPAGNSNHLTHGLASRLVLGKLTRRKHANETPAEQQARRALAKVEQQAAGFRAALTVAARDVHGTLSLARECLIQTAARWERHALLATRWLRERHDFMDDAQRLAFSREIARASAERDKAIAGLRLDRSVISALWDTLDATARDTDPTEDYARPVPADAPAKPVGVQAPSDATSNLMPLIPLI